MTIVLARNGHKSVFAGLGTHAGSQSSIKLALSESNSPVLRQLEAGERNKNPLGLRPDAMGFGTGCAGRAQARTRLVRLLPRPSGRQHQKLVGSAWAGRGRPPAGYCTKRAGRGRPPAGYRTKRTAEDWLRDRPLEGAQRAVRAATDAPPGVMFAEAAEEYLRHAEEDRGGTSSTIRGHRSQFNAQLLPAFGSTRIEDRPGGAPDSVKEQSP
jgi:hypothetical protein